MGVSVNFTGLLEFKLGATRTTKYPDVAPLGIVMVIDVELHELIVIAVPFRRTRLPVGELPKFDPVMITWLPIDPVVAEREAMTGAGAALEFTETLSKVAVDSALFVVLLTARPM